MLIVKQITSRNLIWSRSPLWRCPGELGIQARQLQPFRIAADSASHFDWSKIVNITTKELIWLVKPQGLFIIQNREICASQQAAPAGYTDNSEQLYTQKSSRIKLIEQNAFLIMEKSTSNQAPHSTASVHLEGFQGIVDLEMLEKDTSERVYHWADYSYDNGCPRVYKCATCSYWHASRQKPVCQSVEIQPGIDMLASYEFPSQKCKQGRCTWC